MAFLCLSAILMASILIRETKAEAPACDPRDPNCVVNPSRKNPLVIEGSKEDKEAEREKEDDTPEIIITTGSLDPLASSSPPLELLQRHYLPQPSLLHRYYLQRHPPVLRGFSELVNSDQGFDSKFPYFELPSWKIELANLKISSSIDH
ncbi:unnamed protein product [Lactuca virosa]|uniref:Uncharacterized protein n=1 Tax=Lactuca virosa TaxID=75947 RepID=A0AAU9P3C2_9ASTR|nr:unnamed protein product [Lactuca virosa]